MSGPDFRDRRRHFLHIEAGTIDQDNRQETLFFRSKMRVLACQEYFSFQSKEGSPNLDAYQNMAGKIESFRVHH